MSERIIVLDTETTGLETADNHRIIEIGAVELVDRRPIGRRFQHYLNPERPIDTSATHVHGITLDQLRGKPKFAEIAQEFIEFIRGATLVIHNAPFDLGFLNYELGLCKKEYPSVEEITQVTDSLVLARQLHPNRRNNLDALCRRYQIDASAREFHGALLDALILADVYIAMTGGQSTLELSTEQESDSDSLILIEGEDHETPQMPLKIIQATSEEEQAHSELLTKLDKKARGGCLWFKWEKTT